MKLKQKIARFILKCAGWTAEDRQRDIKHCVMVIAPHTSNWDFVMGKLAAVAVDRQGRFLIKKEWFFFPLNLFFNWIGGIPVDRKGGRAHMTATLAEKFQQTPELCLAITPEGTRKPNPDWKKGFYYIAVKSQVPIVITRIDYGKKHVGIDEVFQPTGDEQADIKAVKEYYRHTTAKHPENFRLE